MSHSPLGKSTSFIGSLVNLEAEPEAPEFNADDFPTLADQYGSSANIRGSFAAINFKKSLEMGKGYSPISNQLRVAAQGSINDLRRLSTKRSSIVQVPNMYSATVQRRNRLVSSNLPDTAKNLMVDDMYPLMFPVVENKCNTFKKRLTTDRIFFISKTSASREDLIEFVTPKDNPATAFFGFLTGYCMVYPNYAICVFEGSASKLLKALKYLNSSASILYESKILYENFDVPERTTTAFAVYTLSNLIDQPSKPDIVGVQQLVKLVVEKVIQFGLTISQFNKVEKELLEKQIIVASNRAIIYIEQLKILLQTDLLFSIPEYLELTEGVLNLDGLGEDYHWAYANAPIQI